jgi:hypothetical protein
MPVDGCECSFGELAGHVLPGYMETLRKRMDAPIPMATFAEKGVGPATLCRRLGLAQDPGGCYVLMEGRKPVYVGISQHILERLREHVRGGDHYTATLAYWIAAKRFPHGTYALTAMQDTDFHAHFEAAREYLRGLTVAFVEIENPLEQTLFEVYCAMTLDTGEDNGGWNTFATH